MSKFFNTLMYGKSNKKDLTPQDIDEKSKVQLFFEILGVKFWQLVKLNLIMLVFLIPTIVWSYISFIAMSSSASIQETGMYRLVYFAGLIPCLLIFAPSLAGASYVIRNFTQDRHAWPWSDFWQRLKENLKQAVLYMLIYSAFLFLGQLVLHMYNIIGAGSMLIVFAKALFIITYIFVIISIIYVYPMIVTYDLKLKDIIRNSFLLSIGRLFHTVGITLLSLVPAIIFLLLAFVNSLFLAALALYLILVGIALMMYVQITYTTDTFEKYMSKQSDDEDEQDNEEDTIQE